MVSQVVTVGLFTVPQGLLGSPRSHFHSVTLSAPVGVLHVESHRLTDARILHVGLNHASFVDVGDADGRR